MKNRTCSFIAALICLVMLIGCLGGCGNNDNSQSQSSSSSAKQQSSLAESGKESESAQTQQSSEEEPAEASPLPLVAPGEEVKLTIGLSQNANIEDYNETNELTKWLEEQTGVDLEIVTFSSNLEEMKTQFTLMTADAGAKLPDIMIGLNRPALLEYGEDGYMIDLRSYLEDPEIAYWWNEWKSSYSYTEEEITNVLNTVTDPETNEIYGLAVAPKTKGMDNVLCGAMINGKFLEAVGEEVPTTIDELCNVLQKFKDEDPNGNGKADELPLMGNHAWRCDILPFLIGAYVYVNDNWIYNVTGGKIWEPRVTDEYRQALIKLNQMYKDGLISPLYFTIGTASKDLIPIYTPADGVPIAGVMGGHITTTTDAASTIPIDYDFQNIPPLQAETDKGGYGVLQPLSTGIVGGITEDCENPEIAFRFLDFFSYNLEAILHQRYGVEGVNWAWAEEGDLNMRGEPATYKVLDDSKFNQPNNFLWKCPNNFGLDGTVVTATFTDDGSVSSFRTKISANAYDLNMEAPQPAETMGALYPNAEEQEVFSEYDQILHDYIMSQRDLFITGALDPNNDADWESYLKGCEDRGLSEDLVAYQSAYDRLHQ